MSCSSCTGDAPEITEEFLGYSQYNGSDFPSQCGGGQYGTYGCDAQVAENHVHRPGCQCQKCKTPYSFPYFADRKSCVNPHCSCGDACDGNCKCGANEVNMMYGEGHLENKLIDIGITNGSGLKGHLRVPFLNIHVDFKALLRYVVFIIAISSISYYFLGLRLKR